MLDHLVPVYKKLSPMNKLNEKYAFLFLYSNDFCGLKIHITPNGIFDKGKKFV